MKEDIADKEKTYIYDSKEVMLTGRRAIKEIKKEGIDSKVDTIYEIKPSDNSNLWTSWIRLRDLYKVEEY